MRTRIMILLAIAGLILIYVGIQQSNKLIPLVGIFLVIVGLVGSYLSAKNKSGMGFLKRL